MVEVLAAAIANAAVIALFMHHLVAFHAINQLCLWVLLVYTQYQIIDWIHTGKIAVVIYLDQKAYVCACRHDPE